MSRNNSWLKENTYHHSEFRDIRKLVEKKQERGLRISLCLPTLNEEQTIGKEVILLRSELMDRYPLLDEIAVIDSGSNDRTLEIAENFGADTYRARDILPDMGEKKGKGENLWKAIYQLSGDILVYVDTDIMNIHPRFVYGLLGPLVLRPEIQYVKAFYDRPLGSGNDGQSLSGGRVTQILIYPLFSLFFPDLTAVIQPLSGEYAVRREVLETIHFPIGYGVETSHLIDVHNQYGLEAFAQTDLDKRVHDNKPTEELSKMAFGILQTFIKRARSLGIIEKMAEYETHLCRVIPSGHRYAQDILKIKEEERPPMIEVEAYRKKFKNLSQIGDESL